jgi:serine protease Do
MDSKVRNFSRIVGKARIAGIAIALAFALGLGLSARGIVFGQQQAAQTQAAQLPSPVDLSRAFINVAKQVGPAVVNIDVVEKPKQDAGGFENMPEIPGFPRFNIPQQRAQRGTGSGVIISPDGYILTNNHVAGGADQIKVKLADGREFRAKRVGADPETDLAVVKIEADNLPFARLGNSDASEQGEWVVALGSPFGLEKTMTAGIISAKGRAINGTYDNYLQTDASINPGNSGGPLVNMAGEVIGINTMILSRSGANEGVGLAIPSNMAKGVYAQLIRNGKVSRGYLGVFLGPVTPAVARSVGYDRSGGAIVEDLGDSDSPAAKSGLKAGDVIIEFDGQPVISPRQLTQVVAETPVGKSVPVKYVRDGHIATTTIKLSERPDLNAASRKAVPKDNQATGKLGINVQNVDSELAKELSLKIASGAVVESVQPGSPAEDAGLQRGDVIHRIGRKPVTTGQDLTTALSSLRGDKEVVLQIERGGRLNFVTVSLE